MEIDSNGFACCGEDFMAGTICSDKPGHPGAHSCLCQACGGDWMNETCTCTSCAECGIRGFEGDDRGYTFCGDCGCGSTTVPLGDPDCISCFLQADHYGPCRFTPIEDITEEQIQAAIDSIKKAL